MAKRLRVIIDAGPLIALAKLNVLPLFKQLYRTVSISQTVYEEVVTEGLARGYTDAGVVKFFWEQQGWSPVVVRQEEFPKDVREARLDLGEKESITLAARERGALLLVDEEAAREVARERGVRVKGTLGLLVEAFRKGLLSLEELELLFAHIEQRDDIWISAELCQRVLTEVGKERRRRGHKKKP